MSDDRETLRLVYAGRRTDGGHSSKPTHCWIDEGGEERYYGKVKGVAIGGIYTIQAVKGARSVYPATLSFTGDRIEDGEQIATWQALDVCTMATVGLIAAERRMSKSDDLDAALAPLLRMTARLRNRNEAAALARLVSDRVIEAYWKEH